MADAFYPVITAGVTPPPPRDQESFVQYALRSYRGVETPAAAPGTTTRRGFNAEAEHTARADAALLAEHDENGIHATIKLARAFFFVDYDGSAYTISDESEDRGTLHGTSSIATVTKEATTGRIKIVLTTAMPTADMWLEDVIEDEDAVDTDAVLCLLHSVTSSTTFYVERWMGDSASSGMVKAHGSFRFAVGAG